MSDEGRGLTKWQVALAVGASATAVVGVSLLAYALCKRRRTKPFTTAGTPRGAGRDVPAEINGPRVVPSGGNAEGTTENAEQQPKSRALEIKQQGNALFKQGKYVDAISCYVEGMDVCPAEEKDEISKFHHNIAAAYDKMAASETDADTKRGHWDSVVKYCSLAIESNPRYVKALSRRAKSYEALGHKKDALLDVTRVLVLDSTQNAAMAETVAHLLKDIGEEQSRILFPKLGPLSPTKHLVKTFLDSFIWCDDLSEERLRELWVSHKKKSVEQAQDPMPQDPVTQDRDQTTPNEDQDVVPEPPEVVEESPDLYEGFSDDPFVRAAAMFRDQEYLGIVELLTEAIETGCPAFLPHSLLLRGTMYILWRQADKALKDLTEVVNTKEISNGMVTNALIKKASVYAGNHRMEEVTTCFDRCFVLDPECPDALMHKARVGLEAATDTQGLEAVIEDFKKTLSKVPDCPYAAFSMAAACHRQAGMSQSMQMLSQATEHFNEASKKYPDFVDGLVLHAMFLQDMGQFSQAEDILKDAAKREPDNSTVHFTMGILNLVSHRDTDAAIRCIEKAISVDNSCIQAYDTLASLEIQRGNAERAVELYDQAVQFSRSELEMGQALVAREVLNAQALACKEYDISMRELTSRGL